MDDQDIEKYLRLIKNIDVRPQSSQTRKDAPAPSPPGKALIDPSCDIRGIERMQFGRGVVIQKDCWLNIAYNHSTPGPMIIIEEGTNIGRRCTLSVAHKIHIGRSVLLAPNVFIADTHHEYQDVNKPIMHQGITTTNDQVIIGDGSWIGINAVIMGNVTIGKHCVVGANAVVKVDKGVVHENTGETHYRL